MQKKQEKNKTTTNKGKKARPNVNLTKTEIAAIKKRMAKLRANKNNSTQSFIPYIDISADGICHVEGKLYTKTIQFYDINYRLATFDEMSSIFSKYCDLLNYFDNSIKFQLSFENQNSDLEDLKNELDIPPQDDAFNDIRVEYSEMVKEQLIKGTNGKVLKKYITFGIEADSIKAARVRLDGISSEIVNMLKQIGVANKILDGKERLEVLYKSLNPFVDDRFIFDWAYAKKTGLSTKDFIAPASLKLNKSSFEMSGCYGAVSSLNILSGELTDKVLEDFLSCDHLFAFDMHVETFDQAEALKFVRTKLTDLERMKIDEQKKAVRAGYDPDILPPNLKSHIEGAEKVLAGLNSKNERLFKITFLIRSYAQNKKKMKLQQETLKRIAQKNNCKIIPLEYTQEKALASTFPIGYNAVPINRVLTTSAAAIFVPFTTQELFQGSDTTYYGLNALSNNMILAARTRLKNPNGLILGTPGSGKSFATKREILDVFLKRIDDIFICDPEGEYYDLVVHLGGQIIKISSSSKHYINPMDIYFSKDLDEDPIAIKSDFLTSFMELVVGGKLLGTEITVIDRCVRQIYNRYLLNNPTPETMPILEDLWKELKRSGDSAARLADSLELYVKGSQNIFNHRSTIDMTNRIVCFDIKELGNQLRKIGMLILQDAVWNRVSQNRNKKSTRYYIDEFHLLLREEQTAKYSVEMWKRFRKWGGVPTGITQNVKDLLQSQEIENIFDNSDFIYMLNQSAGDRDILQEKLHISEEQIKYVTNSGPGQGLIFFGDVILPFKDDFPKNTVMYSLMTTNPEDKITA